MTRISREIRIHAPKEKVWAAIADLGAIQDFHPGVKKSYYTSEQREGVGASRHCDLKPFGFVVSPQFEKIVPAVLAGLKRHVERQAKAQQRNGVVVEKETSHV